MFELVSLCIIVILGDVNIKKTKLLFVQEQCECLLYIFIYLIYRAYLN